MNLKFEPREITPSKRDWAFSKDLFLRCQGCRELIRTKAFLENHKVCPKCDYHKGLSAYERVQFLLDEDSFTEYDTDLTPKDPLAFTDRLSYKERFSEATKKTDLKEAIVTGEGAIRGSQITIGVMDFRFIGGSMGSVVGEKIARCFERAQKKRQPVVIFSSSGGARMHEGIFSLMQMAKTVTALSRHHQAGLLFISVLCSPTFGGTTASFSALGDVVIAEPKALIGFAGRRVIEKTIHQKLPDNFQQAEHLKERGFIDMIVHRRHLKDTIAKITQYLA